MATKRFYIDQEALSRASGPFPTNHQILKAVYEKNDKFYMEWDPTGFVTLIVCENKPRNMPIYGIFWKEAT